MDFITPAYAAAQAPADAMQGGYSQLLILGAFFVVFYFMLWRPQQKRAKDQRQLVDNLAQGDEVVLGGGLVGTIVRIKNDFVVLSVGAGNEFVAQKSAVVASLPKGTLKSIT